MDKLLLPSCCLFLLSLTGCGTVADGVTYRSGFYGDLFPLFGRVGQIGSEALGDEILYDDGLHEFKRERDNGYDSIQIIMHYFTADFSCAFQLNYSRFSSS